MSLRMIGLKIRLGFLVTLLGLGVIIRGVEIQMLNSLQQGVRKRKVGILSHGEMSIFFYC